METNLIEVKSIMITVHIDGIMLGSNQQNTFRQNHSFVFDGRNDSETERLIIEKFNHMVSDGFVNVCCVNEDSEVPEEYNHLRYSKPYAYKDLNIVDAIFGYSIDE